MFVVLEALQWIQLSFLRQNNFKKKDQEVELARPMKEVRRSE